MLPLRSALTSEFVSWGSLQDARRIFEEGRGSFWDIPAVIQAPGLSCTLSEIRGKSKAGAAQPFLGEREMMSSVFPITTRSPESKRSKAWA